jgi:hypothetical protein
MGAAGFVQVANTGTGGTSGTGGATASATASSGNIMRALRGGM